MAGLLFCEVSTVTIFTVVQYNSKLMSLTNAELLLLTMRVHQYGLNINGQQWIILLQYSPETTQN
jgi:hypothetical protein